jgi:cob(I)alamin adenosyltransferase
MQPILVALLLIFGVAAASVWLYRGLIMSLAVRLLASRLPNAAKRHGLQIRLGPHRGGWIRLTLQANLGKALSEIMAHPIEAAAYSRFGGFNLSRLYSDFMNPRSPYYQCWLGAYVVFDSELRRGFGFDDQGTFVADEVRAVLEADQRLVYRSTGCPHTFPNGNAVRLHGELTGERLEIDGMSWWRILGEAETWSAYHRGASPNASRLRSRVYGVVPHSEKHEVDDYHPLRYQGEFWLRYFPELGATCAKFFVWPRYTNRDGNEVSEGQHVAAKCRELLRSITFTHGPATMKSEKGLIQVYTGHGKGKTTAALGQAMRAAGQGLRVYIIQFMKGWPHYGELESVRQHPNVTIKQFGRPDYVSKESPEPVDIRMAEEALEHGREIVGSGDYDLVVLDEINVALEWHLIQLADVLSLLDQKPVRVELILTGRYAHPEVIARADLVTEMREIKHPYHKGIVSRRGIEY